MRQDTWGNQETQNENNDVVSQHLHIIETQKNMTRVNECYLTD